MDVLSVWFLALALAMDCFAMSVTSGIILKERVMHVELLMALLFGLFQAMMPLLGWMGMSLFKDYIEAFDHWIAFALLLFLGGKMILDSFKEQEEKTFNPRSLSVILVLAVATSIDALAIGITFSLTGYDTLKSLAFPLFAIGIVSFLMSVIGTELGMRFSRAIERYIKPELLGGIILIIIGCKVLLEHLL